VLLCGNKLSMEIAAAAIILARRKRRRNQKLAPVENAAFVS
jgi:hypothetical protein